MAILREDQLYTYATSAGFTGGARDTIVAISQAESGGNTSAYNGTDPNGGSFGVLQINGSHFGPNGTTNKNCALDPLCSFQYAYQLSNGGTDFHDWGSYTNGSYTQYLNPGGPGYTSPNASGTQPSANLATGANSLITGITDHAFLFLIGLAIVVVGFIAMKSK